MSRCLILCLMLLHATVQAGSPSDEAIQLYERGQFEEAAQLLIPLAEAGDAPAQHKLSVMYFYGRGVQEDEAQAMQWAQRSADSGNIDAMYFIGTMYVFGDEIPTLVDDPDVEAATWMFKAASRGHADAEYGLGLMFLAGKGVVQDYAEAMKWIRRAADRGHAGALSYVSSHETR